MCCGDPLASGALSPLSCSLPLCPSLFPPSTCQGTMTEARALFLRESNNQYVVRGRHQLAAPHN